MFVRLSVLTVSTLACLSLVSAAAHPRRSSLPACNPACPQVDTEDHLLGILYDTDRDPIFCTYPPIAGDVNASFNCEYDKVSGETLCSSVSNDFALS